MLVDLANYIFYKFDTLKNNLKKDVPKEIENDFQYSIWKPIGIRIWPKGFLKYIKEMRKLPIVNMVFWWIVYKALKRNGDYSILIIKANQDIAHYTVILPKNYRFPFADKNDLILGPVWTNPKYRKKGLVYYSLKIILKEFGGKRRQLWWISNENNIASRISVEKAGFKYYGKGKIMNNWLKVFSYFKIENSDKNSDQYLEEVEEYRGQ